ncbi:uncharacterized protein DS421_1g11210 [Arachis hypogaea]|nr:uncharacterized protein DS421_1g11210 [Arachis hypogaea]
MPCSRVAPVTSSPPPPRRCAVARKGRIDMGVGSRVRVVASLEPPHHRHHYIHAGCRRCDAPERRGVALEGWPPGAMLLRTNRRGASSLPPLTGQVASPWLPPWVLLLVRKGRCLATSPACLGAVAASVPSPELGGCCHGSCERRREKSCRCFGRRGFYGRRKLPLPNQLQPGLSPVVYGCRRSCCGRRNHRRSY